MDNEAKTNELRRAELRSYAALLRANRAVGTLQNRAYVNSQSVTVTGNTPNNALLIGAIMTPKQTGNFLVSFSGYATLSAAGIFTARATYDLQTGGTLAYANGTLGAHGVTYATAGTTPLTVTNGAGLNLLGTQVGPNLASMVNYAFSIQAFYSVGSLTPVAFSLDVTLSTVATVTLSAVNVFIMELP